ncbi:MAG: tyrosine-type recombinase/integrase [Burkholderiaceae bacterium]|nr:tyrosine-type recombinase/integrase [Burkholderiaceae bacterium]
MSTLRLALDEYLQVRRALGYRLREAGAELPRFVSFMEERRAEHITARLALEWALQPKMVQPAEWARRLGYVRGFARYRSAFDSATEVPAGGLLPHRRGRARPYLYTEQEIDRLLSAALGLPTAFPSTRLRPRIFHCLIGLLSVTGLRISEALGLHVGDVDLGNAVLTIRGAKLGRDRLVPIHATTCAVLSAYLQQRERFLDMRDSPHLFASRRGKRLDIGHVHRTFYTLSRQIGLRGPGDSHGPRLHDLRHRFAVMTLLHWYSSGDDPARRLSVLSTYLGHVHVADTYWYLSAWPELMAQAMARLERRWGESP